MGASVAVLSSSEPAAISTPKFVSPGGAALTRDGHLPLQLLDGGALQPRNVHL
jgi:hypothetical protein